MPGSATSGNIWYYWTNANGTAATTNCTWSSWNNALANTTAATVTGFASISTVWAGWNSTYYQYQSISLPETRTAEQIEADRLEQQAREEARRVGHQEARERALRLLREHLSPDQQEEMDQRNHFTVISADGERRYRIERGRSRNVRLVGPDGRVVRTYCAHPSELVPDEDTMLAQKLMLEFEEEEFLRIANAS